MSLTAQSGSATASGDLVSQFGDEIRVALDRWSVGQLEVGDLIGAASVLVVGLDDVITTILRAPEPLDAVVDDPVPEVQVAGLAGRLVVVRVYVWHDPPAAARRAAVDGSARAVLAAVGASSFELAGPEWVALEPMPGSSRSGLGERRRG